MGWKSTVGTPNLSNNSTSQTTLIPQQLANDTYFLLIKEQHVTLVGAFGL